jgi:hypothetical protein
MKDLCEPNIDGVERDEIHLVRRLLVYQDRMTDECGTFNKMKIGRENRSTRRKRASASLIPP